MRRLLLAFSAILSIIFICSFCCSCCKSLIVPNIPHIAANISDSTVALVHTYRGNTKVYCTGVWVSSDVILTANHCVEGLAKKIYKEHLIDTVLANDNLAIEEKRAIIRGILENNSDEMVEKLGLAMEYIFQSEATEIVLTTHPAISIATYHDLDLALVKASGQIGYHKIARLADKTPEAGEHVNIVGHPGGLYWTYTSGVVAAIRTDDKDDIKAPFIQVSGFLYFGNSGGGMFNDFGELEGVASMMSSRVPGCSYFISTETIRSVLLGNHIITVTLNPKISDPVL